MFEEFNSLSELMAAFPDEQTCIEYLEYKRWRNGVVSPYDATSKVYKCKGNNYKCRNTGLYFNAKTGTLFHSCLLYTSRCVAVTMALLKKENNTTTPATKL